MRVINLLNIRVIEQCGCDCCVSFKKFLKLPKLEQEKIFLELRKEYKNDTPEVLKKYKCWRSLDNFVSFIIANVASGALSSGGSHIMRVLGFKADSMQLSPSLLRIKAKGNL